MSTSDQKISIFLVGCGGIGIEVINNIVYIPNVQRVEMTDMDVVELSNLSRQYIFTKEDIGLNKSEACQRYLSKQRSDISVVSHISMVQDEERFPVSFFGQFDYVINALDNLEARKHVSKFVYVANLLKKHQNQPLTVLADLGTAGLKASAVFYTSLETSQICCRQNQEEAPIPVCTLRSKPTSAKHCAIFARFLVERIFTGIQNELVDFPVVQPPTSNEEAKQIIAKLFEPQEEGYKLDLEELAPLELQQLDQNAIYPIDTWKNVIFTILTSKNMIKFPFTFDKDDISTRQLISAITNIRCSKFKIQQVSTFQAAGDAGRIVPALPFANAAVAAAFSQQIFSNKCKNQIYFFDVRPPYVFQDTIEAKYKVCDFCCAEFGICGVSALEGMIYTIYGEQVTPGNGVDEGSGWGSSDDAGSVGCSQQALEEIYRPDRLYIQKLDGCEPRYVYTVFGDTAYEILQEKVHFQAPQVVSDVGSSDFSEG